jgi:hypothetical protein
VTRAFLFNQTGCETVEETTYRLCPKCFRAVPARSGERYCANDGERLLEHCPVCETAITSPYAQFCVGCGFEFRLLNLRPDATPGLRMRDTGRDLE